MRLFQKNIIKYYYKMVSFGNLTSEELMILATLRNADGYKNIFGQQLENIFVTPPTLKPLCRPALRPKKLAQKKPTSALRPKKYTPKKPIFTLRPKMHKFDDCKPKQIAGAFDDNYYVE